MVGGNKISHIVFSGARTSSRHLHAHMSYDAFPTLTDKTREHGGFRETADSAWLGEKCFKFNARQQHRVGQANKLPIFTFQILNTRQPNTSIEHL